MSNKKNLPNIPIYIGDWERDCNVLTLESEAAWMRIVFKLWTKGKQSSIKIPTKSLQNLWRCTQEKMREILDDLIYNEIAEIKEDERFVEFTCRRFVKENHLSEIRSKASKGNQNANKTETKPKQKTDKKTQNSDNEIDYDNESEDEIKNESKKKKAEIIYPFNSKKFITQWDLWKKYKKKEFRFNYKSEISEQAALKKLSELSEMNEKVAIEIIHQSITNSWKGLFKLKLNGKSSSNTGQSTINRQTRETIEQNSQGW